MATYENSSEVRERRSEIFRVSYRPGALTPFSGIYVCTNCRDEIASNKGNPLPPQNHRQHANHLLPIEWQLLVLTERGPD